MRRVYLILFLLLIFGLIKCHRAPQPIDASVGESFPIVDAHVHFVGVDSQSVEPSTEMKQALAEAGIRWGVALFTLKQAPNPPRIASDSPIPFSLCGAVSPTG